MQPAPRRKKQVVQKTITVPGNLAKGCSDFNAGKFYESHEHFEEVWQYERGPVRDAYKGLIHIAAAYVHLSRTKYPGAERLLRTALGYLAPYREHGALGFDVERICRAAEAAYARVLAAGPRELHHVSLGERPFFSFDEALLRVHAIRDGAWGFDGEGKALLMEITIAE